jgi:hypothetical protein
MQPLAAGRFAETDEAKSIRAIPHFLCGFDHSRKVNFRSRIEIEDEATWDFRQELRVDVLPILGFRDGEVEVGEGSTLANAFIGDENPAASAPLLISIYDAVRACLGDRK